MKLAILSDIHSAAGAYAAALDAALGEGFDILVLLGDLLTYGPFPERTLEITMEAASLHQTVLIEGNHDQIYLAGADGEPPAYKAGWIGESIDWTRSRIDVTEFADLEWQPEFVIDNLLFAHANPYAFGDWSYLRTEEEFRPALSALSARGLRGGIFGHSHRHAGLKAAGRLAVTVGSVGQPRNGSGKCSQWAMVELNRHKIQVDVRSLDFDWRSHCDSIRSTSMSEATKHRLCGFFA